MARTRRRLAVVTIVWAVPALLAWVTPFGPLAGNLGGLVAAVVVTAVPGAVFLAASRRRDLIDRLRQALLLFGVSITLTAVGNALRLVRALGVHLPTVAHLDIASTVVLWAIGLAALLRLPLIPLARGGIWRLATDTAIAVGGVVLVIFAVWTLPGLRQAPATARMYLLEYNAMEVANLVVLNLIVVRGPARAIRSAYWWLVATIVIETTYLVALQYAIGVHSHSLRLPDSLFFVDYLAYVYAATMFLTGRQPEGDVLLWPEPMQAFNPLPVAAIVGVGVLLILSSLRATDPARVPLAVGSVVLALLLLARVVGATGEILRLHREEAADDQRRRGEWQLMMQRLAGGIAHRINNLMTVVLGYAEMLATDASAAPDVRSDSGAIAGAAHEAAALAERLLLAAGRTPEEREQHPLSEIVGAQRDAVGRMAAGRAVSWRVHEGEGTALVGRAALEVILRELVSNAVDATPAGGSISIEIRDETVSAPGAMTLAPTPGRYSVLEVSDAGRGIPPEQLGHVHEPFFTTRPQHEGRGLGLSVVYGIVAGWGGGMQVDSAPGQGTRVAVYLPAARGGASG
jgi:signal transduction histidine kinase